VSPAYPAFALVVGKRWIEQLADLPDRLILNFNGIAVGAAASGRRYRA
jgi:hypothetical protein